MSREEKKPDYAPDQYVREGNGAVYADAELLKNHITSSVLTVKGTN